MYNLYLVHVFNPNIYKNSCIVKIFKNDYLKISNKINTILYYININYTIVIILLYMYYINFKNYINN